MSSEPLLNSGKMPEIKKPSDRASEAKDTQEIDPDSIKQYVDSLSEEEYKELCAIVKGKEEEKAKVGEFDSSSYESDDVGGAD